MKKNVKPKAGPSRSDSELYQDALFKRLREIKGEAELSNETMAPLLGVSVFTLSRWFAGSIKKPNRLALVQIGRFIAAYDSAKAQNKPLMQFIAGARV